MRQISCFDLDPSQMMLLVGYDDLSGAVHHLFTGELLLQLRLRGATGSAAPDHGDSAWQTMFLGGYVSGFHGSLTPMP